MNVAIVPARGGSKGIPRKNLLNFCGKPLLAWSIEQATRAAEITNVYVSSDDDDILDIGKQYGALPIKRPQEFASDTATSESALLHAVNFIQEQSGPVDWVTFLQATSPLRESSDIDGAFAKLRAAQADSLFTVSPLNDHLIWKSSDSKLEAINYNPRNRGRRQDRVPLLLENGSFYIFSPSVLRQHGNRLGPFPTTYEMSFWKSFEIDEREDVELCEYLFARHRLNGAHVWQITARKLSVVFYDFDGVMTDNRVLQSEKGEESVTVNRGDGLAVASIKKLGISQIILSTETNPVVGTRAMKLGIDCAQSCVNKRSYIESYCRENGIALENVLFIGNDINDREALLVVGYAMCPADAHHSVAAICGYKLSTKGGDGVIRELFDHLC